MLAPRVGRLQRRTGKVVDVVCDRERDATLEHVVYVGELTVHDSLATIPVIAIRNDIENVAQLTWDGVGMTDDSVNVRPGKDWLALPFHGQAQALPLINTLVAA